MDEFNSNDYYIYYYGQESLRRNGVALIVNKESLKCSTWVQSFSGGHKELDMTERLHTTTFCTLFLTTESTPFLLRDSCPQW